MLMTVFQFISNLFRKKRKNKEADLYKYKMQIEDNRTKKEGLELSSNTFENNSNIKDVDVFRITRENTLNLINRTQKLKRAIEIKEERNYVESVDLLKGLYASKKQNKTRS